MSALRARALAGAAALAVGLLGACHDAAAPDVAKPVGLYVLSEVDGKGAPFFLARVPGYYSAQYAVADTIWILEDRSTHRSEWYSDGDPTAAGASGATSGASYGGFYYVDGTRLVIRWNIPLNGAFSPGRLVYDSLIVDGARLRRRAPFSTCCGRYTGEWVYTAR